MTRRLKTFFSLFKATGSIILWLLFMIVHVQAKPVENTDLVLQELPLPPPVVPAFVLPFQPPLDLNYTQRRALYLWIVKREAQKNGLPSDIADSVVTVESSYNPTAIGTVGEIGLMQIRPTTAALLGFKGTDEALAEPGTNIQYGIKYLAQAWRLSNGQLCRALMKYRAGHGQEFMTPLSVQYCVKARHHLASIGSEFAKAPVPASVAMAGLETKGKLRSFKGVRRTIWLVHSQRLKDIEARLPKSSMMIIGR